ncbi:hypothetical protein [uncultured Oscillibacter sp.]|uniref:hypothetical protein n=1 Tax=uncultured Oscillibacter sp. TaxID=876091 RepID=UPI0025FF73AB|nr:hypothetical protein [uncultured Oscillibacter sp.]
MFDLFRPLVGSDGPFHFTENLGGCLADRRTQHIGRRLGIEVEHIHEIFRLKTVLRVLHTAGAEHILDAGLRRPPKGHPYVELIIPVEEGIVNDAEDAVLVLLPIFSGEAGGDAPDLLLQPRAGPHAVGPFQHILHSGDIFLTHGPEVDRAGVLPLPGVRHIEHIAQLRAAARVVHQGDALGAAAHIAAHGLVPEVILGAGRGVRALLVDHELLIVGVFVEPGRSGKEGCPLLPAPGHLSGGFFRHLGVIGGFRGERYHRRPVRL